MDNSPVMRADDEERSQKFEMSAEHKKAIIVMAVIQSVMIALTYLLFAMQLATAIKTGVGCIATIIIYMVIYLNFLKLTGYLKDCGIKLKFWGIFKVLSPILYFVSFILCITTMV